MQQTTDSFQDEPAGTADLRPLAVPPEGEDSPGALTNTEQRRHARIQSSSLAVLATGGLLTLMYVAKSVLVLILISVLLAFMLAPIVELCQRLRLPRSVGAMFAVLLMCGALYGVFYVSYNQADQFITALPKYSGNIRSGAQPGAHARRTRPPDHPGRAPGGEARKGYAHGSRIHQLAGRADQRRTRSARKW